MPRKIGKREKGLINKICGVSTFEQAIFGLLVAATLFCKRGDKNHEVNNGCTTFFFG